MKDKKYLFVSECFTSIQGEGQTIGVPAVFLRLSGCNLLCKSDNWICDTIEVWQKGVKTNYEDVLTNDQIQRLKNGAHLVLTGGEPLLHQNSIEYFIKWIQLTHKFIPIIEVETNGTIKPNQYLASIVTFWNVSPKLNGSGEPEAKRLKKDVIQWFNSCFVGVIFKFVISSNDDLQELNAIWAEITSKDKWVLMPAGETQSKLDEMRQFVANKAIEYNCRFSDRLHITIWNEKTGV